MYYLVTDAGGQWETIVSYRFLSAAKVALAEARRVAPSHGVHYLVTTETPEERRRKALAILGGTTS